MALTRMARAALIAGALAMAASAAEASTGCNAINALGTQVNSSATVTLTGGPVTLDAGDFITITNGPPFADGPQTYTFSAPISLTVLPNTTASVTIATSGTFTITRSTPGGASASTVTYACVNAAGSGSENYNQNTNNAQAATQNGQQTLQTFNDWILKGVMTGLSGGGSGGGANAPAVQPVMTAQAKLRHLLQEESERAEELANLPAGVEREEKTRQLAETRRALIYARVTMLGGDRAPLAARPVATPAGTEREDTRIYEGAIAPSTRPRASTPTLSFTARDLPDACEGDICVPPNRSWNAWLEGKAIGLNDSLTQTNSFGFVGGLGVDYRLLPYLSAGLSIGGEGFETRFGPANRVGTAGVSVVPYLGVRLDENIFMSAFVGLTRLNYNTNPAAGVSGNFQALRVFFGGALAGTWRDGPWRFQPMLQGTYGSESQNAYVASNGASIQAQTVGYGRISLGPEVGYTFWSPDKAYSVEPFFVARAQLDFASSNLIALNGQVTTLRPGTQGSGAVGAGVEVRYETGFFFRVQGSYDSIGVTGLDVWTGLLRGGISF